MSRGIHFVTTHVAMFMATCMFSLGALGAWTPENKNALVAQIGSGCPTSPIVGPGPDNESISQWNVSRVTDMSDLFKLCRNFNEDISGWETSQVTTFYRMFLRATAFNQPLNMWNTSKATTFKYMFYLAEAFNQPLNMWNTSKALTFDHMFGQATAFNQPLGSWNTEKATDFEYMFEDATTFNQPLGSWNTEKVTDFESMFIRALAFNQPLGSWNTVNVMDFQYMFFGATAFNQPLGSWNTVNVQTFQDMFRRSNVSIDTTAYWDTTNTGSEWMYLSPQQPCPAGYDPSQTYSDGTSDGTGARKGTLAIRCPDGCNVAGYGEDVNGFCAECVPNNDRYYINGGSCTTAECNNAGSTEYYNISAVYTDNVCSVATCAKGTKPAADQLSCDSCATVSGSYYTTAGDCTTVSCTPPAATEYFDTSAVYTTNTCSVATCAKGTKPAADQLSCEKEKEAASDSNSPMAGAIVGSVVGVLVLVAVAGILVWVFVIRPRRLKSRRRRDLLEMHTGTDIDLEAVTNNDEPVSRPSPSIEYREKEL